MKFHMVVFIHFMIQNFVKSHIFYIFSSTVTSENPKGAKKEKSERTTVEMVIMIFIINKYLNKNIASLKEDFMKESLVLEQKNNLFNLKLLKIHGFKSIFSVDRNQYLSYLLLTIN